MAHFQLAFYGAISCPERRKCRSFKLQPFSTQTVQPAFTLHELSELDAPTSLWEDFSLA